MDSVYLAVTMTKENGNLAIAKETSLVEINGETEKERYSQEKSFDDEGSCQTKENLATTTGGHLQFLGMLITALKVAGMFTFTLESGNGSGTRARRSVVLVLWALLLRSYNCALVFIFDVVNKPLKDVGDVFMTLASLSSGVFSTYMLTVLCYRSSQLAQLLVKLDALDGHLSNSQTKNNSFSEFYNVSNQSCLSRVVKLCDRINCSKGKMRLCFLFKFLTDPCLFILIATSVLCIVISIEVTFLEPLEVSLGIKFMLCSVNVVISATACLILVLYRLLLKLLASDLHRAVASTLPEEMDIFQRGICRLATAGNRCSLDKGKEYSNSNTVSVVSTKGTNTYEDPETLNNTFIPEDRCEEQYLSEAGVGQQRYTATPEGLHHLGIACFMVSL